METVAYLRVSTRSQDLSNQKLAILEFSQKRRFTADEGAGRPLLAVAINTLLNGVEPLEDLV